MIDSDRPHPSPRRPALRLDAHEAGPMMSTEINLDPSDTWGYLSPNAPPANVPTTGEDSSVIAPWTVSDEPVCMPLTCPTRVLLYSCFSSICSYNSPPRPRR